MFTQEALPIDTIAVHSIDILMNEIYAYFKYAKKITHTQRTELAIALSDAIRSNVTPGALSPVTVAPAGTPRPMKYMIRHIRTLIACTAAQPPAGMPPAQRENHKRAYRRSRTLPRYSKTPVHVTPAGAKEIPYLPERKRPCGGRSCYGIYVNIDNPRAGKYSCPVCCT